MYYVNIEKIHTRTSINTINS